jgi:hypothetical protein
MECEVCHLRTAVAVAGPKSPSALAPTAVCTARTDGPVEPVRSRIPEYVVSDLCRAEDDAGAVTLG